MSFAMCDLLGFLGSAGQMPQQISPLPTRWALSASSPREGLLPSGSSLYASKYHLPRFPLTHAGPFFLTAFLFFKYIKLTPSSGLCTCVSLRSSLG